MSSRAPAREESALTLAEQAYDLVQADPGRAKAAAEQALVVARHQRDRPAEVAALHALSWAQHVLGDPRAERTARAGIRVGTREGDRRGVALVRRRLAMILAFEGRVRGAQREIDAAIADLSALDAARSEVFRIAIHRRAHSVDSWRHRVVLANAAKALTRLRRGGDAIWEARLLYNRGLLLLDRGELDAAGVDVARAGAIYRRQGARAAAADATLAIAEISLQRGDFIEYLRATDELRSALPHGELELGLIGFRPLAFAQLRLLPEAQVAATEYLELCRKTGRGDYASSALLDVATVAIHAGDASLALASATSAARSFAARGKPVNTALARGVALRARLLGGTVTPASVPVAVGIAGTLEQAGWRLDALRAHVLAGRVALAAGAKATARRQLELARAIVRQGTVLDRIELEHSRALLRLSDGDVVGARRALHAGLDLLDEYRAGFGAVELRATASGIGSELSELGVRLALRSRDPAAVLEWSERLRAASLRLPPVRPPADPQLRAQQTELRALAAELRQAEHRGSPERGLVARQAQIEAAIRAKLRHVRGGNALSPTERQPPPHRLGDRAVVEYVELDGELRGITVGPGRVDLHELGVTALDAATELGWLRFSLRQLARSGSSAAQRNAARANARAAAAALDQLIVEPLLSALGDAPLVIVPTGALHALPWAALPSLRGRSVVVAPSIALWLDLAARPRARRERAGLVAGPRLRHATAEVRAVAPLVPHAAVLRGRDATVAATLAALDGAALAHVACHGRFRADNPLFSSLELADGPLTALDLQQLRRVPDTLILSSCDLALSERYPGDELLGFSAALLAMGTRTIVASVVPVPDSVSRRLMVSFHGLLAAGRSPAAALAEAQASLRSDWSAAAGFVCLGSG